MEIAGERTIGIARDELWDVLLRVDVLEACVPGMQELEREGDIFKGTVGQKLAGITVSADAKAEIVRQTPPETLEFAIEGQDNRINSRVDGSATIELSSAGDEETHLEFVATVDISGKLASLGSRLIKRQVNKNVEKFFSNLQEHIEENETAS